MTQPAPATSDRARANFEAILNALLPHLLYFCVWEYRVVSATGAGTAISPVIISARSTDPRLPDLASIKLRAGETGGRALPIEGASILIGFVGGNPQAPYVHSLDPDSLPTETDIPATAKINLGAVPIDSLAFATPTLSGFSGSSTFGAAISTFAAACSTFAAATKVIVDSLIPASGVTGGQITAWNGAEDTFVTACATLQTASSTLQAALAAIVGPLPTVIVKGS